MMKLTTEQKTYLDALGIINWQRRDLQTEAILETESKESTANPACASMTVESPADWQALQAKALSCEDCQLHETRKNVVFGVGDPNADLCIVGEAPGSQEDLQGEPFVGRAGMLLNNMLSSINLSREKVYIANVLKCRPPGNRDPSAEEVLKCTPILQRQLELIQPKLIFAIGRFAAHFLLQSTLPMKGMRGRVWDSPVLNKPVIVSYHPAYLLRSPSEKSKALEDMLAVKQYLES